MLRLSQHQLAPIGRRDRLALCQVLPMNGIVATATGRLDRPATVRYSRRGVPYLSFLIDVAAQSAEPPVRPEWMHILVFGTAAETLSPDLRAGAVVQCRGRLRLLRAPHEDDDPRALLELIAANVKLVGPPCAGGAAPMTAARAPPPEPHATPRCQSSKGRTDYESGGSSMDIATETGPTAALEAKVGELAYTIELLEGTVEALSEDQARYHRELDRRLDVLDGLLRRLPPS